MRMNDQKLRGVEGERVGETVSHIFIPLTVQYSLTDIFVQFSEHEKMEIASRNVIKLSAARCNTTNFKSKHKTALHFTSLRTTTS